MMPSGFTRLAVERMRSQQPVALKKLTSSIPGVHSLPEKVRKLQHRNTPQRRHIRASVRLAMSNGGVA